jgi:hypothetical protein
VEFASQLPGGLPEAVRATARDGRGQLTPDVMPDSLFLRYLGHDKRVAKRYHVILGKYLSEKQARGLRISFVAARLSARHMVRDHVSSPLMRRLGLRLVDGMKLTDEILDGDLIVSADSARLMGAGKVTETRLAHQQLKTDAEVLREVVRVLLEKK